jgi:hypothetical protein
MYPGGPGNNFDMAYYCTKHIPLAQRLLGSALKAVAVEEGSQAERSAHLLLILQSDI